MELAGGNRDVIINPRYRRSAVLRALHATLAGRGAGGEVIRLERGGLAFEPAGAGDGDEGPEGGEEDDDAGYTRTTGVQRNI